jgi:lipopolysaccharide/colanic/teichoic acid biosynthesis glycosyltransferase
MLSSAVVQRAFALGATAAGFGVAVLIYSLATRESPLEAPYGAALLSAALVFWIITELRTSDEDASPWVVFTEHVTLTIGANLILQALLGYAFDLPLAPLPVLAGGSAIASAFLVFLRELPPVTAHRHRLLLVGYDPDALEVARAGNRAVIGVVDDDPSRVPPSLPVLGTLENATATELSKLPARIVLGGRDWLKKARVMFELRLAGLPVEDTARIYERTLRRVRYSELSTPDLLFSPALKTGRHIMAIQAVYTDLMGLILLILLSPVLLLTGLALAIFGGPGPALERLECLGFQNVPFQLLRFRTRNARSGAQTYFGDLIARLHLVNLPQLLNIIRGEMVFFGPRPVRREFAERLGQLLPFYYHRFSVKPGVIGWAQVNVPRRTVPPEPLRMEYDFYYIRQSSIALDFEILMRSILGGRRQPEVGEVTP